MTTGLSDQVDELAPSPTLKSHPPCIGSDRADPEPSRQTVAASLRSLLTFLESSRHLDEV